MIDFINFLFHRALEIGNAELPRFTDYKLIDWLPIIIEIDSRSPSTRSFPIGSTLFPLDPDRFPSSRSPRPLVIRIRGYGSSRIFLPHFIFPHVPPVLTARRPVLQFSRQLRPLSSLHFLVVPLSASRPSVNHFENGYVRSPGSEKIRGIRWEPVVGWEDTDYANSLRAWLEM